MPKDKDGNYLVPNPYDIAGSAHFKNKADNCIAIYRDIEELNALVDCHVQKIRFKDTGRHGLCHFSYDYESGRFIGAAHAEGHNTF